MREPWNFTFFIARKLQKQQLEGKKVARPITRIATISIAIAMIVNCVTIAVVNGFQQEVSRKVIGFGSHISIQKQGEASIMESSPLMLNPEFLSILKSVKGVSSVQSVAYKPALLQSSSKIEQKEILGVVLKGVDNSYNWSFFKSYLKKGNLPKFDTPDSQEMLISARIAKDLHYKVGDLVNAYFVKQNPIQRQFVVCGIYETGLEDFDKELVFCYLPQVQQLNDWGIQAEITIDDTLEHGELIVRAQVSGGNGNYRYDWGKGYERYAGFSLCPTKDTTIRVIVSDYWMSMSEPSGRTDLRDGETSISDTAYLQINVSKGGMPSCQFQTNSEGELLRTYLDDKGYHFSLNSSGKKVDIESFPGHGSFRNYIGSYEVMVDDFNELDAIKRKVQKAVLLNPSFQQQVKVNSIKDNEQDIFVWLSFLDVNMAIVLVLMLVIGIVNMGSALLVIILVRSNFIGIFKAMGASNWVIQKVFLAHIGRLILKGMIWGNLIGIGLCLLQSNFNIMPLDPKIYYLNAVPVSLDIWTVVGLNALTFVVCLLALLIPSLFITRISPAKSIRFR